MAKPGGVKAKVTKKYERVVSTLSSARFGWRMEREKRQRLAQPWLPYPHEKGNKREYWF